MLHFLGFIIITIGAAMIAPAIIAPIVGETHLIPVFLGPAAAAILIGVYLRKRYGPSELSLGNAMVAVTAAWLICSAFSSVPYMLGAGMPVEDAYFESVSGFTATGLTMISCDPVANHIVISEVGFLPDPENGYIELYNPTGSKVNISGLKVWTVDSSGALTELNMSWNSDSIQPYGYFLISSGRDNASDAVFSGELTSKIGIVIGWGSPENAADRIIWGAETAGVGAGDALNVVPSPGDSFERKALGASNSSSMRDRDNLKGNGFCTGANSDFVYHFGYQNPQGSRSAPEAPVINIAMTPKSILFWRSFTQWIGGLGVVVLFLAAVIGFGKAARKFYVAEARAELLEPSIKDTVRSLWKIYIILTVIGAVGLYVTSLPRASIFEAVNHAMTGIATGGFSVRNDSFASYGISAWAVMILVMMAGAISFAVHRKWMSRRFGEVLKNIEVRLMICIIIFATIMLSISVSVGDAIFQSTSALTGTGFSTTNIAGWNDASKSLLTLLMIVGGGYGSTSSALKLIRVIIIGKSVYWLLRRSFLPERAVYPMKISGKEYSEKEMMETTLYALVYIIVLIVGAVVLISLGYGLVDSLFESASAQGNVGLSTGITSQLMPLAGKVTLTVQMIMGRLEIIPVIAFMGYLLSKVPRPGPKPV
ncbi:MAG: potassium transporter TrkG [Candidatus Hadarchaeales archaeon]